MGHFHSFKSNQFFCWAFSFVLFTVHVVENVQVTSKLSPQNHFITKHNLFLKQFHQLLWFVNTLHMFNRCRHAYRINQEKVKKSLFKSLFIIMKFQTPSPFYPPYLLSAQEFWKYFASWLLPLDSPIALILHASHLKLKSSVLGIWKIGV